MLVNIVTLVPHPEILYQVEVVVVEAPVQLQRALIVQSAEPVELVCQPGPIVGGSVRPVEEDALPLHFVLPEFPLVVGPIGVCEFPVSLLGPVDEGAFEFPPVLVLFHDVNWATPRFHKTLLLWLWLLLWLVGCCLLCCLGLGPGDFWLGAGDCQIFIPL